MLSQSSIAGLLPVPEAADSLGVRQLGNYGNYVTVRQCRLCAVMWDCYLTQSNIVQCPHHAPDTVTRRQQADEGFSR